MSITYDNVKYTFVTGFKLNIFWTAVHWCSVQLYQKLCIPNTIYGYIFTPMMVQTPHCKMLIWFHSASIDAFNSLKTVFVAFAFAVINTYFSVDNKLKIK